MQEIKSNAKNSQYALSMLAEMDLHYVWSTSSLGHEKMMLNANDNDNDGFGRVSEPSCTSLFSDFPPGKDKMSALFLYKLLFHKIIRQNACIALGTLTSVSVNIYNDDWHRNHLFIAIICIFCHVVTVIVMKCV